MINSPVINQNGCKGATLTLDYDASGTEVAPMRITRRRGLLVSALLTLVVLATIGAASAYWSGGGGGDGGADTGTAADVTLTPGTASAELYPGGSAAVTLSVSNPNDGPVHVGQLVLDTSQGTGGFAVDGGHTGCVLTTLSFTTQTNGGPGWDFVSGSTGPLTLTNSVSMSAAAANACQGATFTVYLDAAI